MKVKMDVKPTQVTDPKVWQPYKSFFGKEKWHYAPKEYTRFLVTVDVTFTEEEKAAVIRHGLGPVVLYEKAMHTKEEIELYGSVFDDDDEFKREFMADARKDKHVLTISSFAREYKRIFPLQHEAGEFMDTLEREVLPKMSEVIKSAARRTNSKSLEF